MKPSEIISIKQFWIDYQRRAEQVVNFLGLGNTLEAQLDDEMEDDLIRKHRLGHLSKQQIWIIVEAIKLDAI